MPAGQTSLHVTGLPVDGRQLWVRLRTQLTASDWVVRDYQYTAWTGGGFPAPEITGPVPGSVLDGDAMTLSWTATGPRYRVEVGSSLGGSDLFSGFTSTTTAHVTGLPTDGSTVFVRVGAGNGDDVATYNFTSVTYTAWSDSGGGPVLGQYFRLRVHGGWGHFKLGHNPTNLWGPNIDPTAGGATRLELTLRDVSGNADWDQLLIAPSGDTSGAVALGDYIEGQPSEWITVSIPLTAFVDGVFEGIARISLPFSGGAAPSEILLARVVFRGDAGSTPFVWFGEAQSGDPGSIDNNFEDSAAIEATREDGG